MLTDKCMGDEKGGCFLLNPIPSVLYLFMVLLVLVSVARLCSNSAHPSTSVTPSTHPKMKELVCYIQNLVHSTLPTFTLLFLFSHLRSVSTWDRSPWPKNWLGKAFDCWKGISLGPGSVSFSKHSWKNIGIPVPWTNLLTTLVRSEKPGQLALVSFRATEN